MRNIRQDKCSFLFLVLSLDNEYNFTSSVQVQFSYNFTFTGSIQNCTIKSQGVYLSKIGAARDNGPLPILGLHCQFQQQQMNGYVWKYEEGTAVVGYGGKGADEEGRNGAGTGNDIQVGV